jgi:hypothetical protein
MWHVCDISNDRLRVAGAVHQHSSALSAELVVHSESRHEWQGSDSAVAKAGLRCSRLVHGRHPLKLHLRSVKRHSRYWEEVVEVLCQVSQSSRGTEEDPSLEAVVAGTMGEGPVEGHK